MVHIKKKIFLREKMIFTFMSSRYLLCVHNIPGLWGIKAHHTVKPEVSHEHKTYLEKWISKQEVIIILSRTRIINLFSSIEKGEKINKGFTAEDYCRKYTLWIMKRFDFLHKPNSVLRTWCKTT